MNIQFMIDLFQSILFIFFCLFIHFFICYFNTLDILNYFSSMTLTNEKFLNIFFLNSLNKFQFFSYDSDLKEWYNCLFLSSFNIEKNNIYHGYYYEDMNPLTTSSYCSSAFNTLNNDEELLKRSCMNDTDYFHTNNIQEISFAFDLQCNHLYYPYIILWWKIFPYANNLISYLYNLLNKFPISLRENLILIYKRYTLDGVLFQYGGFILIQYLFWLLNTIIVVSLLYWGRLTQKMNKKKNLNDNKNEYNNNQISSYSSIASISPYTGLPPLKSSITSTSHSPSNISSLKVNLEDKESEEEFIDLYQLIEEFISSKPFNFVFALSFIYVFVSLSSTLYSPLVITQITILSLVISRHILMNYNRLWLTSVFFYIVFKFYPLLYSIILDKENILLVFIPSVLIFMIGVISFKIFILSMKLNEGNLNIFRILRTKYSQANKDIVFFLYCLLFFLFLLVLFFMFSDKIAFDYYQTSNNISSSDRNSLSSTYLDEENEFNNYYSNNIINYFYNFLFNENNFSLTSISNFKPSYGVMWYLQAEVFEEYSNYFSILYFILLPLIVGISLTVILCKVNFGEHLIVVFFIVFIELISIETKFSYLIIIIITLVNYQVTVMSLHILPLLFTILIIALSILPIVKIFWVEFNIGNSNYLFLYSYSIWALFFIFIIGFISKTIERSN